jgi:hypothetical protein
MTSHVGQIPHSRCKDLLSLYGCCILRQKQDKALKRHLSALVRMNHWDRHNSGNFVSVLDRKRNRFELRSTSRNIRSGPSGVAIWLQKIVPNEFGREIQ